jgi:hypothetical protein
MVDLDIGQINIRDGSDEVALQYLGAAVVLTWQRLPPHGLNCTRTGIVAFCSNL